MAREVKEKEVARALPNAWSHDSHNNQPFPPTDTLTHVHACLPPPYAQSPSAHTITGFQPTAPPLIALIFGSRFTAPTFSKTGGALCIMAEKTFNVADIDSKHCSIKQHTHTTINNQQQHTRNQQRKRKSISSSRATTAIIISFRWVPTRGSSNFFLENLRSKPGTHEFHAFNVQTHTGSNLLSPSPFYPLRVDSQARRD